MIEKIRVSGIRERLHNKLGIGKEDITNTLSGRGNQTAHYYDQAKEKTKPVDVLRQELVASA